MRRPSVDVKADSGPAQGTLYAIDHDALPEDASGRSSVNVTPAPPGDLHCMREDPVRPAETGDPADRREATRWEWPAAMIPPAVCRWCERLVWWWGEPIDRVDRLEMAGDQVLCNGPGCPTTWSTTAGLHIQMINQMFDCRFFGVHCDTPVDVLRRLYTADDRLGAERAYHHCGTWPAVRRELERPT